MDKEISDNIKRIADSLDLISKFYVSFSEETETLRIRYYEEKNLHRDANKKITELKKRVQFLEDLRKAKL